MSIKTKLAQLGIAHRCPACNREKPGSAFAWHRVEGIPPCRECSPGRRQPDQDAPIDIAADREGRILQLVDQFKQSSNGVPFSVGAYRMPGPGQWNTRFTAEPELMARILRDLILDGWWRDNHTPGRTGRRPSIQLTAVDLVQYLPLIAAELLPEYVSPG